MAIRDYTLDNYVCVDFEASNPVARAGAWLGKVLPVLREAELGGGGEPIVVSGVNVKASRTSAVKQRVPARDMAGFALGVDLFGVNHKPLLARGSGSAGLFSRKSYYYVSVGRPSRPDAGLTGEYDPSILRLIAGLDSDAWRAARAFNAIVQGWEAGVLREKILEEGVDGLAGYMLSKPGLASDAVTVRALRRAARARRLT